MPNLNHPTATAELTAIIGIGSGVLLGCWLLWTINSDKTVFSHLLGKLCIRFYHHLCFIGCYGMMARLIVCFHLSRYCRKLLAKLLLGVVAILEFLAFCQDFFCCVFYVHNFN